MLIQLDDFRKAKTVMKRRNLTNAQLKDGTYGGNVVNATSSPARLYALNIPAQQTLSPELPSDFSKIDLDTFMNRVYALATQV